MKNLKTSLSALVIIISLIVCCPQKASADVWGTNVVGAELGAVTSQLMDVIYDNVQAALVQALKQAAIEMIADTVNNMISGTSEAGAMFITNWEDYLFNGPKSQTALYMNDFFAMTANGRSGSNYQSSCGSNFSDWRVETAKSQVNVVIDLTKLKSDFQTVACDAKDMFEEGTWEAFDQFMKIENSPAGLALIADGVMEERERKFEKTAEVQSISYQGFTAKTSSDGKSVLTPGSTIKDIESHVNEMAGDSLSSAQKPGEIVGAVVSQLLGSVIQQGIGNIQSNVQSQINEQICNASGMLADELERFAPSGEGGFGYGIGSLGETGGDNCNLN
ncbi:hypothetical protein ACFL08_02290 [Patescibacteria group bacterium]